MVTRISNSRRPSGSGKENEPKVIGEVLNEYFQSNEPSAVALRDRLFKDIHPHTEPCCQLKLLTRQPGRPEVGTMFDGTLVREGEDRFVFCEQLFEKKKESQTPRNAHLYEGTYINVNMRDDGVVYPTFRYGRLDKKNIVFRDFCREAAEELVKVAGRIEE